MIDLNNLEDIQKLDPKNVFGSTGMLADQCTQIWQDTKQVTFPENYKQLDNIIICGMGGSAYGGHIVKELFKQELPLPIYINSDYHLPGFATENSLIVLTSYSGSTEESLSNAQEALKLGAKITGVTSGGKLGEFLKTNNFPALIFSSQFNPSNQPRLGTGYIILGTIALFNQLGILSVSDQQATAAIEELKANHETIKFQAQETAKKIMGNLPMIFGADFLVGNAHIMRNQFNETSKSFSAFSEIPELNHHLMEGLKYPSDKKLIALILNSNFYEERIAKRTQLTEEIVTKNNIPVATYTPLGSDKLSQMLNVLSFGGYVTVYLGLLYGEDPSLIPWVDYFKEQLSK
ncbi:MAG TPA: SIS domain-containing protein [Patescibacteria group bacterium]